MQWILLLIIGILLLVFILRKKLLLTLSGIIQLTFIASFIISLVALFFQAPFTSLASFSLERNGTLTTIKKMDNNLTLDGLKETGSSVIDTIGSWFGQGKNGNTTVIIDDTVGPIEKEVYPGLVATVAGIYRGVIFVASILGMALAIYLSFTVSGSSDIEVLKQRIARLEQQLGTS